MRIDTQTTQGVGNVDASRAASTSAISNRSGLDAPDSTSLDVVSLSAGSRLLDLAKSMGTQNSANVAALTASVRSGNYSTDPLQVSKSLLSDHIRA